MFLRIFMLFQTQASLNVLLKISHSAVLAGFATRFKIRHFFVLSQFYFYYFLLFFIFFIFFESIFQHQ